MVFWYMFVMSLLTGWLFYTAVGKILVLKKGRKLWQIQLISSGVFAFSARAILFYPLYGYLLLLVQLALIGSFYNGSVLKKTLAAVMGIYHIVVVEGFIYGIAALAFREGLSQMVVNAEWRAITSGSALLISGLGLYRIRRGSWGKKMLRLSDNEHLNRQLLAGCLPLTLLFISITTVYYMPAMPGTVVWIFLFVCLMSLAGFHIFIRYNIGVCEILSEKKEAEEQLAEQLDDQLKNYMLQAGYIDKFRRFRYDYSNRMKGLAYLLDWGMDDEIKDYIRTMSSQMDMEVSACQQYSNNSLVDAILQDASVRSRWCGIDFQAMVDIRNNFQLTDLEICTVFSNILDNALEAAFRSPEQERFIELRSNIKGNWQAVTCRNSYVGTLQPLAGGGYRTTKEDSDGHGFGLRKISEIVEGKGGIVSIEAERGIFSITLCMEVNGKKNE